MRRVAVGVLVLLLALTGCSQVLGIADWDKIVVNYTDEAGGDYALVVTPAEAISTIDGEETSHKLPDGFWNTLVTGVRALGEREAVTCAEGQAIKIQATSGGAVKQTYAANSCDAGDALKSAQKLVEQLLPLIK